MNKSKIVEFSNSVRDKLNAEVRSQAAHYEIYSDKIYPVDEEYSDSIKVNEKLLMVNLY